MITTITTETERMKIVVSSSESSEQNVPPLMPLPSSSSSSSFSPSLSSQERVEGRNLKYDERNEGFDSHPSQHTSHSSQHTSHPSQHTSDPLKFFPFSSSNRGDDEGEVLKQEKEEETSRDMDRECDQLNHSRKRPRSPSSQQENRDEKGEEEDLTFQESKRHRL